jgi:hypothetical protein
MLCSIETLLASRCIIADLDLVQNDSTYQLQENLVTLRVHQGLQLLSTKTSHQQASVEKLYVRGDTEGLLKAASGCRTGKPRASLSEEHPFPPISKKRLQLVFVQPCILN